MDKNTENLVRGQFDELVQVHKGLALAEDRLNRWVVRGDLSFHATYNSTTIEDAFSVLLTLPRDYPQSPPSVQETGCRISRNIDYHVYPRTGNLCLGAPLGVRLKFLENPCLMHFVNELLIPFLFSFSYKERYGKMPYGELLHGYEGICEFYQDLFGTKSQQAVLGLLKIVADNSYRGHLPCPCGSGRILRKCHGNQLRELVPIQPPASYLRDIEAVLCSLSREDLKALDKSILPRSLQKSIHKGLMKSKYRSMAKYA